MRRLGKLSGLLAVAACSTEPSFETGSTSSATAASTSGDTGTGVSASAAGGGAATTGAGGDGGTGAAAGGGGVVTAAGPGGGGTGGTGGADPCGNGQLEPGEECDAASMLCDACRVVCPDGWAKAPSGTRCFLVDGTPSTFFDAASRCAATVARGARARLATPRDVPDLEVAALLADGVDAWVGLADLDAEGAFTWIDGSASSFPVGQAPWGGGQPDDFEGRQDCVYVAGGEIHFLDDVTCTAVLPAICELVPGWGELARCEDGVLDPGEECEGSADERCASCNRSCNDEGDGSWVESPVGAHACFRRADAQATQDGAESACDALGGRLATPARPGELAVIRYLADGSSCWLGATDDRVEGSFEWISGEPFDYQSGVAPWGLGEPDGGAAENCLMTVDGALRDQACTAPEPFPMCEIAL